MNAIIKTFNTMIKEKNIALFLISLISLASFHFQISAQNLKVSDNNRFLVHEDNSPFFYLGDTAWELFIRLNKKETEFYLRNRAGKDFNVIQCVLTGTGMSDLEKPTKEGNTVFIDMDPTKPNDKHFDHVDWVIDKADELGMYLAMLPVWATLVVDENPVLDKTSAYSYGLYLGNRYKNKTNLIWVLGGDKRAEGYEQVWENLAKGIKDGGSNHLMTYHYHLYDEQVSSDVWQSAKWLSFNMVESGHMSAFDDNYRLITEDYNKIPIKPVLDGELMYEGILIGFCSTNGKANTHMVRVETYWSVFAGAFGFTYGQNSVWQFYNNEKKWSWGADISWKEGMEAPGSFQMQFLKNLMLSRPYLSRIPDQSIIEPKASHGVDHIQATRDGTLGGNDATYIMVYFPFLTHKYKIHTDAISASKLRIWWFDPRTGEFFDKGEIENTGIFELPWGSEISTNNTGPDWVLVIDDGAKKYPPPEESLSHILSK